MNTNLLSDRKHCRFLLIRATAYLSLFLCPSLLWAAPGDLIGTVNLPVSGFGVSVGVDCDGDVYYTISGSNSLIKMSKTGLFISSTPITDSSNGAGLQIDEIAWDNSRMVFWGCLHNSNPVRLYKINPVTGVATFAFTSSTISIGTFRDGLAYDASDDSLWISGDVSTTIEHHKADGTFINVITPKNAVGGNLGAISGVSVGVGDQLYLGRNGFIQIVRVRKSDGGFLSSFTSPGGQRDEGLECDPINFAPKLALWSREFNSPGFVAIIELEPGTCGCGGAPDPTGACCIESTGICTNGVTEADCLADLGRWGGSGSSCDLLVPPCVTNNPPDANCKDVTVNADGDCEGNVVAADVDDGSSDPDGDPLTYALTPAGPYPLGSTEVTLTVTDPDGLSDTCTAKVTVVDGPGTPPSISCPADTTVTCGQSTNPPDTGSATGEDNCDDDVAIGHSDSSVSGGSCLANPTQTVITRTWTATDDAGNSATCEQQVTVEKVVLPVDLHPTSCPNPLNRGSNGVIPAALLGSATFNVADIDLSSVRLSRADCVGDSVAPNAGPPGPAPVFGDVGTPFGGTLCDCHTLAGDGYPDLVLKFKTSSAVQALQLGSMPAGTYVTLVISGSLNNGCKFIASDCMRLTPSTGASAPALVKVTSNIAEAWVDVAPADLTLDEGGFANFVRAYPSNTVVTLTASATMGSKPFRQWIINGVPQADGLRTISVKANGLMNLEARYSSFIPPPDEQIRPTAMPVERQ